MKRQQKIAKLPQETKQYLINQYKEIEQCCSSELLEYSKKTNKLKDVTLFVKSLLFEAVDARQKHLNSGLDKKNECDLAKKVKNFKRGV